MNEVNVSKNHVYLLYPSSAGQGAGFAVAGALLCEARRRRSPIQWRTPHPIPKVLRFIIWIYVPVERSLNYIPGSSFGWMRMGVEVILGSSQDQTITNQGRRGQGHFPQVVGIDVYSYLSPARAPRPAPLRSRSISSARLPPTAARRRSACGSMAIV